MDNAVVIYENIRRRREEGDEPDAATVRGTLEMLIPVAATTMTTIAALVPIVYLSDDFRRDFAPFALAFERYAVEAGGKNVEVVTRIDGTNASMLTRFSEESALTALPHEMLGRMMNLATHFGGLAISVYSRGTGFSTGRGGAIPFDLKVVGYNYDDLRDHAERVARQLERNRRVRKVETTNSTMWSFGGGPYYELQFHPAQRTLARAGVNLGNLDELLRLYADRERHDGVLHFDGRRVPYRLVVDRSTSASDLDRLPIRSTDFNLGMGALDTWRSTGSPRPLCAVTSNMRGGFPTSSWAPGDWQEGFKRPF